MKAISKLWQRWQRFWEPINEIPFIIRLLLGVLTVVTVAVFVSKSTAGYLQQLLSEKYDVLKTIGYCVAGVVSIWLAWAANKRANAIDVTAKEQAKATENTEAGQRQERLKNAIEHLGHDRDSVRMGGAHELFHLAKDTEDLRQTVLDILCAHIRQTTGEGKYKEKYKAEPSEEIQGLLTLLFVQEHGVFEDCSINLQSSYLNGANLIQARLKKAILMEAQLQKVNLMETQLQEADLNKAQLQGADLREAQMQGAGLSGAELQKADLSGAKLQGAFLGEAQMQVADLSNAQMQGAFLREAQLQGAVLMEAQLQRAILIEAQLQRADFMEAQLQGADLSRAQLQGVSSHEVSPLSLAGFESKIKNRIDKPSNLTGIVFAGGLQEENLDTLCKNLSAEKAQELREKLRSHVGQPASHELPENSGAETGTYTQEEAEQWIAKYQEALREVPKRDDG